MANTDDEQPCGVCGYSLRGVGNASACPECGVQGERSRLWAERAARVIPSPVATRRGLAVQAVLEAGLAVVVVATPFVHRAIPMDSPAESRTLSIMYFGWLGLWAASMVSGSVMARTLTRGTARPIACVTLFACGLGAVVLAVAMALALLSGQGFYWAATDTARRITQAADLVWSVGVISQCILSARVMDALQDSKRTLFRMLCYGVVGTHVAWIACRLTWWLGVGELPFLVLYGVNWTVCIVLSSVRSWMLFATIRRWTTG